jgi:3-hydroxyacyl-CoA dehydrogenase/3a,7a,12a-trihydroxy-5b-cholest-24-enoyl-CoA hydratase
MDGCGPAPPAAGPVLAPLGLTLESTQGYVFARMSNTFRFDGKVAIITGAGNGLGKAHALLLASRGAKVVVNDLGGSATGGGKSSAAADQVVAEIKAAGGEAVASYDSVEDGAKIVQCALDSFGRLDVVVNNAGILRDVTFQKMSQDDWDLVYRVHVLGAFRVTHATWNRMRDQGYGRIVMTASAAGIYGNFGQSNYAMAKLGLVGLAQTLALEGAKRNVHVNTIAPIAGSRLTETILPKELLDALRPEDVSPLVAYLCHESCEENGGLFEVGGGYFAKLRWERAEGQTFRLGRPISVEHVASSWGKVTDFSRTTHPANITESMGAVMSNVSAGPSRGGNEFIDVDQALGYEFPPLSSSYDERDLALYGLAVGAGQDPTDERDLRHVYELHGDGFVPLPTYGVVPALKVVMDLAKQGVTAPGMNYGVERLLHGEQTTEILRPLPTAAKLTHRARVKDIFDKGKNALVVTEIVSSDEHGPLIKNEFVAVIRGAGGWGGDRGPSTEIAASPERAPDKVVEAPTTGAQALLYRLTGDWNPLHADPGFAKMFGFDKPILHGLCSFGFAGHAVLQNFTTDARLMKSIRGRFAESVFPGETLVTEMWKESPTRILFRTKVKERDKVVVSNGAVELYEKVPELPKATPAPAAAAQATTPAAAPASAEPNSADVFVGIGKYLAKNASLAARVGMIYQFKLTQPDSVWTVDLKAGAGKAEAGATQKPDCTLELTDSDFMAMCTGKADPQQLYFGKKMKISGNIMASQKLEFLKKLEPELVLEATRARLGGGASPAPAAATPPAAAPSAPVAATASAAPAIFQRLGARLAEVPSLASEVRAKLTFVVGDRAWTADLTTTPGAVREGKDPTAAATLTLDDEALLALTRGEATAQQLYQKGQLRVDGEVRLAQRLGLLKGLGG